jgi:hypothetical protein
MTMSRRTRSSHLAEWAALVGASLPDSLADEPEDEVPDGAFSVTSATSTDSEHPN